MRNLTPKFSNGDGTVTVRGRKRKIYCTVKVMINVTVFGPTLPNVTPTLPTVRILPLLELQAIPIVI